MSASLVGSEMCIRDSACVVSVVSVVCGVRVLCPAYCLRHFEAGSRGPVSYTHLTLPTICSV
eukprot:11882460-Alexandrium_andersonii.AAC.1